MGPKGRGQPQTGEPCHLASLSQCSSERRGFCMYRRHGVFLGNKYKTDSGYIWPENVECSGNEESLVDCRQHDWSIRTCDHQSSDVSIQC